MRNNAKRSKTRKRKLSFKCVKSYKNLDEGLNTNLVGKLKDHLGVKTTFV